MSLPLRKLIGTQFRRRAEGGNEEVLQLSEKQLAGTAVIGLYFANVESPKSVEFTERLIQFWEQMKGPSSSSGLASFEVLLICFDEAEKIVYLPASTSTPFLRLSGEGARGRQEYVIRKYGVQTTPSLILIDGPSGGVINFFAREKMLEDPEGTGFPWRHPTVSQILGSGSLISSEGQQDPNDRAPDLCKDSVKALFFAAHWCPPCRTFLPALIEVYNKLRERGQNFEIIFVSSDRSKESFERLFSQMPWLGIPYEDSSRRQDLTAALNIKAIPTLVILDSGDGVITAEGRTEVNEDPEGMDFPWYPKIVEELRDKHSSVLNHSLCLIYFIGDDDSEYDKAEGVLGPIATQITQSETEEASTPKFFIATDSELSESLRLFIDIDDTKAYVLILDVPNFRYAVSPAAEGNLVDERSVLEFLRKFQKAQLQYKHIESQFI